MSHMCPPKLTLVPPPPSLKLDALQSLTWRDGSALHVTGIGILWVDATEPYLVNPCPPVSSPVSLIRPSDK